MEEQVGFEFERAEEAILGNVMGNTTEAAMKAPQSARQRRVQAGAERELSDLAVCIAIHLLITTSEFLVLWICQSPA